MPDLRAAVLPHIDRLPLVSEIAEDRTYLTWTLPDASDAVIALVYRVDLTEDPDYRADTSQGQFGLPGRRERKYVAVNPDPTYDDGSEYLIVQSANRNIDSYSAVSIGDVVKFQGRPLVGEGSYRGGHRAAYRDGQALWARGWVALNPVRWTVGTKVRVLSMPPGTPSALSADMIGKVLRIRFVGSRTGTIRVTLPRQVAATHGLDGRSIVVGSIERYIERCERCTSPTTACRCVACAVCTEQLDPQAVDGSVVHTLHPTRYGVTVWLHTGCGAMCASCSATHLPSNVTTAHDGRTYCARCVSRCEECNQVMGGRVGYCDDCGGDGQGVLSYHHTRPTLWLGGRFHPDGQEVDFHIGFELEVTSVHHRNKTGLIRSWSAEHLGNRDALDIKSDSSVRGFEIASQPMTPEFFESVDWGSFFEAVAIHHPPSLDHSESREPITHGLHVHIGRVAFRKDPTATAMFCYLLGQGDHLERIGRRPPTTYCLKVEKPASVAIVDKYDRESSGSAAQYMRLYNSGSSPQRYAINLTNQNTIEIRAFRSTRDPEHLKAAVRLVYLGARYVAALRGEGNTRRSKRLVTPKDLHWDAFMKWVAEVMPEALDGLTSGVVPPSLFEQVTPTVRASRPAPAWSTTGASFSTSTLSRITFEPLPATFIVDEEEDAPFPFA